MNLDILGDIYWWRWWWWYWRVLVDRLRKIHSFQLNIDTSGHFQIIHHFLVHCSVCSVFFDQICFPLDHFLLFLCLIHIFFKLLLIFLFGIFSIVSIRRPFGMRIWPMASGLRASSQHQKFTVRGDEE